MPRETEKPPLTTIDEKPIDGTSTSKKDQDRHGTMKSEIFLNWFCTCTHRTQTTNWRIFLSRWSWSDECSHVFSLDIFSNKFIRVSYTCCSNYSVYDGECTHTHLSHAHFSVAQFVCAHSHICMHVHTRMAQVSPKRCVIPLHLAVSLLMIHPSLLFPHVHFETNPDYDFIDKPIHMILPYFSRPESARHAQLRSCIRCKQRLWAPKVRQDHTISPTSRKPRTITLDNSVFPQCLNPLFRTCLTRKHAIGKPLLDSDVKEKSTEQKKELFSSDAHEISLWRVTENPILKSHRKSYSDGWDLWEHLRRRVQQAFFSGISKTTVLGRYSMDRSSSAREYILRRELEMKDHLHQERYARRCQAIEKLKGCRYHEGNYKKKKPKIEIISYTAWSGITNSEPIFYDPDLLSSYDGPTFLIKLLLPRVQDSRAAKLECCEINERI